MINLTGIRQGLAANLAVFLPDYQVTAYMLSAPTPPGFQIVPDRVDFHGTLQDGMEVVRLVVVGHVGFATDQGAQDALDALLNDRVDVSDPPSVREALEADQRLTSRFVGGSVTSGQPAADDVTVTLCTGYRLYPLQGGQQTVLGAEWTVEVRT